ncbi:MAG: hypothetical protein Q9227_004013 [Pyrenula ochraceoflavens]
MPADDQWPKFHDYAPLNRSKKEIRLLRLQRPTCDGPVKCEIVHRSLNERPQYDALSYYWGAPSATKAIAVNGAEVHVRRTLCRFLECLMARFTTLVVWLDAISINQEDVEERNWQVSLMGEIYSGAENVYAWLGEGDPDCEYAMEQIQNMYGLPEGQKSASSSQIPRAYLEELFLRPYWARVW